MLQITTGTGGDEGSGEDNPGATARGPQPAGSRSVPAPAPVPALARRSSFPMTRIAGQDVRPRTLLTASVVAGTVLRLRMNLKDTMRNFCLCCLLLAACANGETPPTADEVAPAGKAAGAAVASERIAGTPEGGLRDWVADIRAGLGDLPAVLRRDAAAAESTAVALYVNRQEWLERYWGTLGTLTKDAAPELGSAVMEAEARFHELLVLLAGSDRPDAARVDSALSALNAQLDQVLARATEAGVPLEPPSEAAR